MTIQLGPQSPTSTIPILMPNEGTQYLGIYITQNRTTKPMEDNVWKKAVLYTRAFQCTHMPPKKLIFLVLSL